MANFISFHVVTKSFKTKFPDTELVAINIDHIVRADMKIIDFKDKDGHWEMGGFNLHLVNGDVLHVVEPENSWMEIGPFEIWVKHVVKENEKIQRRIKRALREAE